MAEDAGAPDRDDEPVSGGARTTPLSEIQDDPPPGSSRVDAAEAVTGSGAGSGGEAPPGGIPGDDSSLEGGDPA